MIPFPRSPATARYVKTEVPVFHGKFQGPPYMLVWFIHPLFIYNVCVCVWYDIEMSKKKTHLLPWSLQSNKLLLTDVQKDTGQRVCLGQEERQTARTSIPDHSKAA